MEEGACPEEEEASQAFPGEEEVVCSSSTVSKMGAARKDAEEQATSLARRYTGKTERTIGHQLVSLLSHTASSMSRAATAPT